MSLRKGILKICLQPPGIPCPADPSHALEQRTVKECLPKPGVTQRANTVTVICLRCEPRQYIRLGLTEAGRAKGNVIRDQAKARRSYRVDATWRQNEERDEQNKRDLLRAFLEG